VPSRPSHFDSEILPYPLEEFYLHALNGNYFPDDVSQTDKVKYKDSSGINYNYGNTWKKIGTWSMMVD
jgi:hypothetical protein